jgi:cytidyltransferase-like protein
MNDQKIMQAFELVSQEAQSREQQPIQATLEKLRALADEVLALKNESEKKSQRQVRIYVDGGFDLLHSGHYNALRQVKAMGGVVVAGINSDADLLLNKGPTIMSGLERAEILRHCKFVDEVKPDT